MFKKILAAFNGSEGSYKALKVAIEMAKLCNSELHVITVARIPEFAKIRDEYEEEKKKAAEYHQKFLNEASKIAAESGVTIQMHLEFGKPSEEIVKKAEEIKADLIVLGVETKHPFKRRFLGGTGDKVVDYSNCSVLVVK